MKICKLGNERLLNFETEVPGYPPRKLNLKNILIEVAKRIFSHYLNLLMLGVCYAYI